MNGRGLPRSTRNPITAVGVLLTTLGAVLFLLFFLVDLWGFHANPYLGIVFFLVMPAIFLFGLALIPLGMVMERRRRQHGHGPADYHWPRVDLNDTRLRRIAGAVLILTIVNIVIVSLAGYRGLEYMDSTAFCGQVCHTVMQPEYTAYLDGPHARVKCVECHIGSGASWFVKSKVDGIRQVWAVGVGTYQRPIPSPVHDLRPARDTCEHCHWPDKFTGDLVRSFRSYADDEINTPDETVMRIRVGGGGWRYGGPHGIHWHISREQKVEYIASDDARETIPYVRLTDASGKTTEFIAEGAKPESYQGREVRTMDCVDCHNRPSHRFAPSAERAVDNALTQGALPRNLPYVRREAVAALKEPYADAETARREIGRRLREFYEKNYADLVRANDGRITQAIAGAQNTWTLNVFPAMQLSWGSHPNHIGHMDTPGCFRCHDDTHRSKDGKTISQDCETCHEQLETPPAAPAAN